MGVKIFKENFADKSNATSKLNFLESTFTYAVFNKEQNNKNKKYKYIKSFKKLLLQTKENLNCILCIGCFQNRILNKIWFTKKTVSKLCFLALPNDISIIYHPNASANNEIQVVFHFELFINRFISSTIPLIEPYNLVILCMLANISPEFCCFGKAKDHLCMLVEDYPCLFSQIT